VDGVGYWNEGMPTFSEDVNALNPYDHPDSELIEDYNLVGWAQDVDGDGEITFEGNTIDNIGEYYVGISSMTQLVLGTNNELYLIFSSVTETFSTGTGGANYRHLWLRMSPDAGVTWGDFYDLTSDLVHLFEECVYPSCAANSDEYIYLVYQVDGTPGVNIWGTGHAVSDNQIVVMKIAKGDITGTDEKEEILTHYDVSQNYPNPFNSTTQVNITLKKHVALTLSVTSIIGQKVFEVSKDASPGLNTITIDAENLNKGIYFYTVKAGTETVTKKMLVE